MADHAADSPSYVPALRKGFALLEMLADQGPMSLAQVERASGLNRTMSYRLLKAMGDLGYVEHDPEAHKYGLGLRVLGLGAVAADRLNFTQIASPVLASLRDELQETVTLGVVSGTELLYVGALASSRFPDNGPRLSSRDPVHATAGGKAILAFQAPGEREQKVAALNPLPVLTPKTIVDPEALAHDLTRTRERGYAVDEEENRLGFRGLGVPVLDEHDLPLAGLSLFGPVERIGLDRVVSIVKRLWQASQELTRRVGKAPGRLAP